MDKITSDYRYCVLALNVATDWKVIRDALTIEEARAVREEQKVKYDIVRIYKFIEGDL